jgi:hypothetical protein
VRLCSVRLFRQCRLGLSGLLKFCRLTRFRKQLLITNYELRITNLGFAFGEAV